MRPLLTLALSTVAFAAATTPRPVAPPDSGVIRIHLLGHAIGSERYVIQPVGKSLALTDTFEFADRGGRVQLASSFAFTPAFEPLHFRSSGRSYRFVNVDADVTVAGGRAHVQSLGDSSTIDVRKPFFTVAGYAPLEMQVLLVRYWATHGRPDRITTVPGDPTTTVTIEDLGPKNLGLAKGASRPIKSFAIDGVAWGREILYTDGDDRIVGMVTRANLLPLEGVREDLVAAHPALLDSILADAARAELSLANRTAATIKPLAVGDFALVGARIIDATAREPIDDGTIVVRAGKITAVGDRRAVTPPARVSMRTSGPAPTPGSR